LDHVAFAVPFHVALAACAELTANMAAKPSVTTISPRLKKAVTYRLLTLIELFTVPLPILL